MSATPDLLLLPGARPDGPRRVSVAVRPQRLAFLVDPADPLVALAAIEAACLTWDGLHQFLVPCPPAGQPDPTWSRVLDKHDPDVVVDLVGADGAFCGEQQDRWDRHVRRWEHPTETMELVGAAVFGALRRWRRLRPQDRSDLAVHLNPLAGHPLALPLGFRFGHLHPWPMPRHHVIRDAYESDTHRRLVDLRTVDPRLLDGDELVRLAAQVPLDLEPLAPPAADGRTGYWTLPALTTVLLPFREPPYYRGDPRSHDRPHPEHDQRDEAFYRRVVVVGEPTSVPDLCLAWNLRAQRAADRFLPVWVAPSWLGRPDVLRGLEWARHQVPDGLSERGEPRRLHLVSASMPPEELAEAAVGVLPDVVAHDRATLDRFFTAGFEAGPVRESIVSLRRGVAHLAVPDYAELGDWEHPQDIGWTVAVEGHAAPRGSWGDFGWPPEGLIGARAAKDGVAGSFDVPFTRPGALWPVGVHDGWEIVRGLTGRAGYDARVSDKGRRAVALVRLLGGDNGLRVLASSLVYGLLHAMAETVERQAVQRAVRRHVDGRLSPAQEDAEVDAVLRDATAGGQFDRQHWTWDRVTRTLGAGVSKAACDRLVGWLVERRVLFQGYEFACPTCGTRRWHPIGRLSETQVCDGCQVASSAPITTNTLTWRYRLNEAVAQAVDQGVLPHLLAANRVLEWAHDRRAPLLGFLPGVLLSPRGAGGPPEIEVDLFAVKGGRVVVGECKEGGDRLTDRVVDRFADLGRRLDCSRVVYATPADFAADAAALERAGAHGGPAAVEAWERADLFDSWLPGRMRDDPAGYLAKVVEATAAPL